MTSNSAPAPATHPTALQALIMVPVVLALIIGFIVLSSAFGSTEFYAGFFFVLYWTGIQGGSFEALPATVAGAFFGLGMAYAMHLLVGSLGTANGSLAFLALLLPVLFCQLAGYLPLLVNNATMLLLTAATISHVQASANFPGMFISLALAVVFFGSLLWGVQQIKARTDARKAQSTPPSS